MSKAYSHLDTRQPRRASQVRGATAGHDGVAALPGDRPRTPPAYLRPKQAAEYLQLGVSTLYRMIARKQIKVASIAGVRLVRIADLDALVESHLQ